jgi:hypothetical protein
MHFHPSEQFITLELRKKIARDNPLRHFIFYTQFEITGKTGENVIHDFDISVGKIS